MEQIPNSVQHFRDDYEMKHPRKFYHGLVHYLFTSSVCLIFIFLSLAKLENPVLKDFLLIPLALILAHFVEYLGHRFLLHIKHWSTFLAYREHTLKHHFYFTHDAIVIYSHRDLHRVLFPWFGILFFVGMIGIPVALLVKLMFGPNMALCFFAAEVFYFLTYENFHMICHLEDKNPIFQFSFFRQLKEHHRLHHNQMHMAQKNFGIVSPLFDHLCNTKL